MTYYKKLEKLLRENVNDKYRITYELTNSSHINKYFVWFKLPITEEQPIFESKELPNDYMCRCLDAVDFREMKHYVFGILMGSKFWSAWTCENKLEEIKGEEV